MTFSIEKLMWSSYGLGFSENLRQLRGGRGLSQQELADLAGLSRNQISNLERNENSARTMADPQLSTVYKLAHALEVPPATLLPGVAKMVEAICYSRNNAAEEDWNLVVSPTQVLPFPRDYVEHRRFAAKSW